MARPALGIFYFWARESETLTDSTVENKVWGQYLTKEYKFPKMLLEKFEYGEVDRPIATKESLPAERSFPLQRPDVDLLLAVGERAVARVPTFLLSGHV